MTLSHRHHGARITTASLLTALLGLPALPALAVDWDGNFPVDGDYDGKVNAPENWGFNTLPGLSDGVSFLANATYTVSFGGLFETGGGSVSDGDVTFSADGGAVRTYAINGAFGITALLTLDGVNLDSGQNTALSLSVDDGGELRVQNGGTNNAQSLRIGDALTNGTVTIADTGFDIIGQSIQVGGGGGALGARLTLVDGAEVSVAGTGLLIGRGNNTAGTARVLDGSSLTVDGLLALADLLSSTGSAVLEVDGSGSYLLAQSSGMTQIGNATAGSARLTVLNAGTADLYGQVTVDVTGTLENLGGTINAIAPITFDGAFNQTAGETNFVGVTDFNSGASFSHTGGLIRFRDDTTIAIQHVDIGSFSMGNPAVWDIGSDVAFNERLRVGFTESSYAEVYVFDNGAADGVLRNTGTGGQADLVIGYSGTAELYIQDHGVVDIFDDVIIGQIANGLGRVFVTGNGQAGFTDRPTLRVERNGSESNLFVGFAGDGLLSVVGGGLVEVGNDLVVQASDTPGIASSAVIGADPSLELPSNDNVTIGNDLLIGNTGTNGGTSSGVFWIRDNGAVVVGNTTRVRMTGELRADIGGLLVTDHLTTDVGSTLNLDGGIIQVQGGAATISHGDLVINGDTTDPDGRGTFQLLNGADAVLVGNLVVADGSGEWGYVGVNGPGSTLVQVPGLFDADVGAGGDGTLRITNGGHVDINRDVNISQGAGSDGTVQVLGVQAGTRSMLVVDGLDDASNVNVGSGAGAALFEVTDGGLAQVSGGVLVGSLSGPFGGTNRMRVGGTDDGFGAEVRTRFITISGTDATLELNPGGLIVLETTVGPPSQVLLNGAGSTLDFNGGDLFTSHLTFNTPSSVQWTGGTLHVDTIDGDLTNNGGTLAPGASQADTLGGAVFDDDYTQAAAGTLHVELAGTTRGTQHDYIDVNAALTLGGTLEIGFTGTYTPTHGHTFDILDWGTLVGSFDTLALPGVGNGNTWDTDNLYTDGTISIIRSGDLNSDGIVGDEDLQIILANWGQHVTPLDETMGDASGNGFVDGDDLQIVLDQFGDTTYPGTSAVPEPGSAALLSLLALAGVRRRRR